MSESEACDVRMGGRVRNFHLPHPWLLALCLQLYRESSRRDAGHALLRSTHSGLGPRSRDRVEDLIHLAVSLPATQPQNADKAGGPVVRQGGRT